MKRSLRRFSSDQGLLLECWCSSIEDEHRLDVVVEQFAYAGEQEGQMCPGHCLSLPVPRPPHRLVQPQAHI